MPTLSTSSMDTHSEVISIVFDGRKYHTQQLAETQLVRNKVQCHKEVHKTVHREPG